MDHNKEKNKLKQFLTEIGFSLEKFLIQSGEGASKGFYKASFPNIEYEKLKLTTWAIKYVGQYNFFIIWKTSPKATNSTICYRRTFSIKESDAITAFKTKKPAVKFVNHTGGSKELVFVLDFDGLKEYFLKQKKENEK